MTILDKEFEDYSVVKKLDDFIIAVKVETQSKKTHKEWQEDQ